jgi:multiple sugar transport system permease protein
VTAAGTPAAAGGLRRWLERERVFKWVPFVPVQGLFALLLLPNFLLLVYLSLLSWRITRGAWWNSAFTGLDAFQRALEDTRFLWALGRTFAFAAAAVPLELLLGFGLALLCRRSFHGRRFYTSVFLLPMMIVPAVVGYDLSMLLIDQGPFNQLLSLLTGRTITVRWLSEYTPAQLAVIGADVWQWTALTFLVFTSGLAGLPEEPIRAARVMGASRWQIFWHVELPLLKPVIAIAVILRSMEALKIFDYPMLLTQAGPGNATETVAVYLWRVGWEFARVSDAAAMSLILLVAVALYSLVAIRILRRERQRLAEEGAA